MLEAGPKEITIALSPEREQYAIAIYEEREVWKANVWDSRLPNDEALEVFEEPTFLAVTQAVQGYIEQAHTDLVPSRDEDGGRVWLLQGKKPGPPDGEHRIRASES